MTYEEVAEMVEEFEIPSAYYQWPIGKEEEIPQLPYALFYFPNNSDFIADNINYASKEILAIERPKSTRVKYSNGRYLVIKRTSKRVGSRTVPVELGTIGEIKDGKYVEIRKEPRKTKGKCKRNNGTLCSSCK